MSKSIGRQKSSSVDKRSLLIEQISSFKKRLQSAIKSGSTALAPSLAFEYLKLIISAIGAVGSDSELFREVLLLKSEVNLYPLKIPKDDPLIQLKWLDNSISKLETIVKKGPLMAKPTWVPVIPPELNLHPKVLAVSTKLFCDGHYSQSIFEALKALESYVSDKASVQDKHGVKLMTYVFNENNPILKIKYSHPQTAKEEQAGLKLIFMGSMLGIRNPKGHRTIRLRSKYRALKYLAFISLLFEIVDDATL